MKTKDFPFRSAQARAKYHAHYMARAGEWPVPSETKIIDTPSGCTFVRISGSPENPALVLLPGSRGTSLAWIPNISALSSQYRTYALDCIYDVGLSVSRKKLTRPEDLVAWLAEVMDVLVPEGARRLVGLSYGGWLACRYALQYPHRVQKLALLAPAATLLPVCSPFLVRALSLLLPGTVFIQKFLYWLMEDTVKSGPSGRRIVDQAVEDWVMARESFGPLPLIAANVIPDRALQANQVPTLYLDGENEKVYSPQAAARRLGRVAPQIKTEIIPGAGHDLWIVQADQVNRLLLDFLAG